MIAPVIWSWPQAEVETLPYRYAHISVGAPCCPNPTDPVAEDPNRAARHIVLFHDCNASDPWEGHPPISREQAEQIVCFVDEWADKVDGFAVNCWGGVSRSAGIAAAICTMLGIDDAGCYVEPHHPNPHVRRFVLEAAGFDGGTDRCRCVSGGLD